MPRCARCHTGHRIERAAAVLAAAAPIAYAAGGGLDHLLGILPTSAAGRTAAAIWAAVACLPALAWLALRYAAPPWHRLAPHRLGYARHHPDFLRLQDEGWHPRPGPFPHWVNPPSGHAPGPTGRLGRIVGGILDLLGATCAIAIPIAYLQGYKELAGGLIMAGAALFFLSSKVKREP
ncbi:hypothetical protein [Streptomyces sp. NPDC058045]|uniref:hypothetical protein n=1 Tax=Streptomyces sp. NPDC058045 TaxID=3346311 RepID=UPI0036EE448A